MNAIAFTCPLPAMDVAMLVARVVPGAREHTLLAVVRPKTGPWLLSPAGTTHLVEHGGGKFTFVDASGDSSSAARDLRVRQVLKGLGAAIAVPLPAPPAPPAPPAGTVPVSGMPGAPAPALGTDAFTQPAAQPATQPAAQPAPVPAASAAPGEPAPPRPIIPAQRIRRRFR